MKAIIVDDESFCISYLEKICEDIEDLDIVCTFQFMRGMLTFIASMKVDLIFMDIEMPELTGIEAVHEVYKIQPDVSIIFITGYEQYAMEAFRVDAVAYILKPYSIHEVKKAVDKARKLSIVQNHSIEIQTFGYFSVFIHNQPYHFSNAKAKELLALLIDRKGSIVTMEQAVTYLWEDRPYDEKVKQLYRKAIIYLHQLANETGIYFFVTNRGSCYIIPSMLGCDYFRLLNGNMEDIKRYCGEYLLDYSWAEDSIGRIEQFIKNTLKH